MESTVKNGVAAGGAVAAVQIADIAADLESGRRRTQALVEPVPEEAFHRQVRPFVSPIAWDLGHIAGFEKQWLVNAVQGRAPRSLEDRYDALETPRHGRARLSLPSKAEVLSELAGVRREVLALLADFDPTTRDPLMRDGFVYRMVMQHEAQHQETLLQALDIPEDGWGWGGAADASSLPAHGSAADELGATAAEELDRVTIDAGVFLLGTEDRTHAYDNERGRHEVRLRAFEIERFPVTNRRWIAFIDDGGYREGALWSAGGRRWLEECHAEHPQGWIAGSGRWNVRRFGNELSLDLSEPVQHVSYWEAEAFARWSGGRLPTEAEWEKAASWGADAERPRKYPWGHAPRRGKRGVREGDDRRPWQSGPPRVGTRPENASAWGVHDMLGSVYEWTSSSFSAYPGFEPFPYPEYSAVFFGDEYKVLRGTSWAVAPILWRNSYRNWDLPQRRQIFAGVRVVYDI